MAKPGWELCSPKDSHTSDDAPFGLVSSESGGLNEESTNVRFFNEEDEIEEKEEEEEEDNERDDEEEQEEEDNEDKDDDEELNEGEDVNGCWIRQRMRRTFGQNEELY